jgi:hypothetical protein
MAASIAGVIWRGVRFIRECRGGAVPSGRHEGIFLGSYCEIFGRGATMINCEFGGSFFFRHEAYLTRTVNGTGHTGPSEFCATSI